MNFFFFLKFNVGVPGNQYRWDITTSDPPSNSTPLYLDVTVRSPLKQCYLNSHSDIPPFKCHNDAVQQKNNKYLPYLSLQPPRSKFTPLAFDSFGSSHSLVRHLLQRLSKLVNNTPPSFNNFTCPNFLTYHAQALSVTIHNGTANSIITTINRALQFHHQAAGIAHPD